MFRRLTAFEMKLQLRNFLTVFFSLAFPIIMLVLFGTIYGNEPNEFTGGMGTVDLMVPAYICMIVAVTGLMSLPLTLASYREQKILKRFMATPVQPLQLLLVQLVINLITTVLGIALLLITAKPLFQLQFLGSIPETILAFLLVVLCIFSLGLMIAGAAPSGKTASTIAYVIYFPMLFLSGASMPLYIMPPSLVSLSKALPLTYGVRLLSGVWLGGRLLSYRLELGVLTGVALLCVCLAVRFFKWE